jgi:hypothetical protein
MAAQQESVERGAFEFLQGASATNKIMSAIADGVRVGIDDDLDPGKAVIVAQIHSDKNAEEITDFVWDFLQKPLAIGKSDDAALVISPDVKGAASSVGEAANPAQAVVAPSLFPLDVLVFSHG